MTLSHFLSSSTSQISFDVIIVDIVDTIFTEGCKVLSVKTDSWAYPASQVEHFERGDYHLYKTSGRQSQEAVILVARRASPRHRP